MKKTITICLLLAGFWSYSQIISKDKQLHFGAGIMAGSASYAIAYELSDGNKTIAFIGSVVGSTLVGLAKESIDNKFDGKDILATSSGGLALGFTIDLFTKKRKVKDTNDTIIENQIAIR